MKLKVEQYLSKIKKFYFSKPGYSYVNDVFLSYQECVLIHYMTHNIGRDYIDSSELDSFGLEYQFWWGECIGRFYEQPEISMPWNKVAIDRSHSIPNYAYDEKGNRISWKKLSPYADFFRLEERLKNEQNT